MDQDNNVQAAIDAGKEIASASQKIQMVGEIPVSFKQSGEGQMWTNLLEAQDKRAEKPRRLQGTATLGNEESFIAHVERFKDGQSIIFGDRTSLTAVYDYNRTVPQGLPVADVPARDPFARWGQHRAYFAPELSDEWKIWIGGAGKLKSQTDFADFLEENDRDIAGPTADRSVPSPADLRTLALTLKVSIDDVLESSINRTTGEYTLVAKQEQKTTGSAQIPREFDIEIPIFTGGPKTRIVCKFRMRKDGSKFAFGWVVPGAEALRNQAMEEMMMRVRDKTQLPVLNGKPE